MIETATVKPAVGVEAYRRPKHPSPTEASNTLQYTDPFAPYHQQEIDSILALGVTTASYPSISWPAYAIPQSNWTHETRPLVGTQLPFLRNGSESHHMNNSNYNWDPVSTAGFQNATPAYSGVVNQNTLSYEEKPLLHTRPSPIQYQSQRFNSPAVPTFYAGDLAYAEPYTTCVFKESFAESWIPDTTASNQDLNPNTTLIAEPHARRKYSGRTTPIPLPDLTTSRHSSETSLSLSIVSTPPPPAPKRKRDTASPAPKKAAKSGAQNGFENLVVVFENAPGALSTVKHRRKLDAPVRKAARAVRKAGACHQCRFRKRTCSTGTPCGSCIKNGNGLHELKCQRESPFIGRVMSDYFESSSTRRVVSFDLLLPLDTVPVPQQCFVAVDGIGRLSHPIKLRVHRRSLKSLTPKQQKLITLTKDTKKSTDKTDDSQSVLILEDDKLLGTQVEQWAVEYTLKFLHAAGPDFHATTMACILGTAYVKKGLPESALVALMLRVASLSFVLRAGIKYSPIPNNSSSSSTNPSNYRTIQASIDTILYQRLQIAEKALFASLQTLIFRSAGCLKREQVFPVALVLWQLLRISCLASSHLCNIVMRFGSQVSTQSSSQHQTLLLLLSTHLALFRSSNPLLLDFSDKLNQDLVGDDKEIIRLAKKMREVVRGFREKGWGKDMRGSIAYRRDVFEMFRRVYEGL